MSDERLKCDWCGAENAVGTTSCEKCGAPLAEAEVVTDSGWRKVPKISDGTGVSFGGSSVESDGQIVPMVSIDLASGDSVYFEHHALLWSDQGLSFGERRTGGGLLKRVLSDAPSKLMTAEGPGKLAISRDSIGELVILPVSTKHEIDVRGGAFILASESLHYSFETTDTAKVERFTADGKDGLLLLHGSADVFQKTLDAGETLFVEPGAFLYKDSSVKDEQYTEKGVKIGMRHMHMVRLTGPGRVGIQSMYNGARDDEE
jgi:uncharacterized protein (AIM24 family)